MRMNGKKLAVLLVSVILAGTLAAGCGKDSEKKESQESGDEVKQEDSKDLLPKGKKLTEELAEEFVEANALEALCKANETVQIETEYVYPDEEGNLLTGGKDTYTYHLTDKGVAYEDAADNFYSYYDGYKSFYSIADVVGEDDQQMQSYDINYYSERALAEMGSMDYGMYSGNSFCDDSVYKETDDGYELYEYYDGEENGATVIVYYANKEKIITSVETTIYPVEGEAYQESAKKLVLGEGETPQLAEAYVNGACTLKVIENAGTEAENMVEFKVPENTNFFGLLSEGEGLSYDPEGTQLIGEDQYDTNMVISKDETLYLVNLKKDSEG